MNGLALCAGIGGIELGLAAAIPAYRTVCYVEREAFCASVLAARMADGWLHDAPIWSDLATFDPRPWRGLVDIVTAGYPCQPFSAAGKRRGAADPRHLWPHVARIIGECQPAYAFLENVPGHVSLGLRDVCADLRGLGYSVSAGIFSAAECGAPHNRKRLFILAAHPPPRKAMAPIDVADPDRAWQPQPQRGRPPERRWARDSHQEMAHADSPRLQDWQARPAAHQQPALVGADWWAVEPPVGRVVDGFPTRVDELRALGNAVVPAVAAKAWQWLR